MRWECHTHTLAHFLRRLGSVLEDGPVEGTDGADEVPDRSSPRQLLPVATVVPPHLLRAPPVRPLVTTQRL